MIRVLLLTSALLLAESPLSVQLSDPDYSDGCMRTTQGGVVKSETLRVQAQTISYTKKEGERRVEAEGDLMIDYGGRIFVGNRLEYDFVTGSGTLTGGVTMIDGWVIGGDKIVLAPDKTFYVYDAYVTTSQDREREWDIYSSRIAIAQDGQLDTRGMQVRFMRAPIFWVPGFRANLKHLPDYPVRYSVTWDKGQGPQFSMHYTLYSWQNASIYGRVDYRWKRGPGGAIGAQYTSPDGRTSLRSDNYYAYDTFYNDDDPNRRQKRFRLQGRYDTVSESGNTTLHIGYDRLSDKNMPSDFRMEDFAFNNAKQTQAELSLRRDAYLAGVEVRPRINNFQGFKQELPEITFNTRPFLLPKTGIVNECNLRLSYLDYVYSSDIDGGIPDFSAFRGQFVDKLYRPLQVRDSVLTPFLGFNGIIYSDNPEGHSVSQLLLSYGARWQLNLEKNFGTFSHVLAPYLEYKGLTKPSHREDDYYIFGIDDGYHRINLFRVGVQNSIYLPSQGAFAPNFTSDLYALGFFGETTFAKTFPKINTEFTYHLPMLNVKGRLGWNTENTVFDFATLGVEWTASADYAFSVEILHRSRYYWRKDDHNNYILDVTRTVDELLASPLSDGRNTLLTKAQLKLAPGWTFRLQTHSGWGRGGNKKGYTEAKADLIALLTTSWRMRLSYMHTVRDDQVSCHFNLLK